MFLAQAYQRSMVEWLGVFNPTNRIYVLYLITALILAFIAYWQVEKAHEAEDMAEGLEPRARMGFLKYIIDPKVWTHPSAIQDMKYFLVNAVVYYGWITQFLIGSHPLSV